jgi:hypothetical protein
LARKSKQKRDLVGTICRDLRCETLELFRKAYHWKRRRIDNREVSNAHATYQRRGRIPDWVQEFVRYLRELGATALPA